MAASDLIKADLHTHSTASDGLDSPATLVRLASERGIDVLAVTDHDSAGGVSEALRAGLQHQLHVVAGVELSARTRRGQIHILGYGIDLENPALIRALAELRESRVERGRRILARLRELGINIDPASAASGRAGDSVGRPHIARELVRLGEAESIADAFERYLAVGRPAFVPRWTLAAPACVELIREAGGLPVLAHPLSVHRLDDVLPRLVESGLEGLEAHYGEYDQDRRQFLTSYATTYNLLVTGGSDYHGDPSSTHRVLGSVRWPATDLKALLERLK